MLFSELLIDFGVLGGCEFWEEFVELEELVEIKIAEFEVASELVVGRGKLGITEFAFGGGFELGSGETVGEFTVFSRWGLGKFGGLAAGKKLVEVVAFEMETIGVVAEEEEESGATFSVLRESSGLAEEKERVVVVVFEGM